MDIDLEKKTDQILVEQTQNGYPEVFVLLVKQYQRKIYQITSHFTSNIDSASDLTQEIFLKTYRSINEFNSLSTFHTWLYRIAYNSGLDYTRKRKKQSVYLFKYQCFYQWVSTVLSWYPLFLSLNCGNYLIEGA